MHHSRLLLSLVAVVAALAAVVGLPNTGSPAPASATTSSVLVMTAGDVACDPADANFNGNNGTTGYCHEKNTSNVIYSAAPAYVFALGDIQYNNDSLSQYSASYTPTWGRFKSKTTPVMGNHEYLRGSEVYSYWGTQLPKAGYWSFNIPVGLAKWHVVVLDSECASINSGVGCASGSPQYKWLQQDLTANAATKCTMAIMHRPRWASDSLASSDTAPLVNLLVANKVELLLTGHAHNYERFAPQTGSGVASSTGIREFVIGTGGKSSFGFGTTAANSTVRKTGIFGALKLNLSQTSATWSFAADPSTPFTDSGAQTCF